MAYGWFTVPVGSDAVVIDGGVGVWMVIVKFCSSNCGIESVTRRVKLNDPELVGVPAILPLVVLRLRPGGKAPLVTPHSRVPMPPVTETV